MRVDIVTLFPSMFKGPFEESIIKRAREKGLLSVHFWDPRQFTYDKHHTVDDAPFGGGRGMVIKPEPIFEVVEKIKEEIRPSSGRVIFLSPQGTPFDQEKAKKLGKQDSLILICAHYEGMDERAREHLADEEISIGDYVLTGGELAAMVIVDVVARMLPGVLGCEKSAKEDSFYSGLLEYPQYTRPAEFKGWKVPEVLLSGNHELIRRWRRKKMLERTLRRRPELLEKTSLGEEDRELLREIKNSVLEVSARRTDKTAQ